MDENIAYGNFGAYFLIILEQFFINGIWGGWGQLCVHFKENNYFEDEFCEKFSNRTQNCDKRDSFFNDVYTISGIIYSAASFIFGLASDRMGMVASRGISLIFGVTGLTLLYLILERQIDEVVGIWIAWPLISLCGLANHISNIRCARATPAISSTLMYLMSGCLAGGASVFLIFERISKDLDTPLSAIILYTLISFVVVALIKLICFTPVSLPKAATNLRKDKQSVTDESSSMISNVRLVVTNWRIYCILAMFTSFIVRRATHQSWLGAGWPQWVVENDSNVNKTTIDFELNQFQSIAYFTMIVGNLIPGAIVDHITKRYSDHPNDPRKGLGIGLSLCMVTSSLFLVAQGILSSFQNLTCAYASIVAHTLGRMWGTGSWNPLYYYIFPADCYGLVFGFQTLGSLPFQYLVIPMYQYIQNNDNDFATMQYVMAAYSSILLLMPLVIWSRHKQIVSESQNSVEKEKNQEKFSDL